MKNNNLKTVLIVVITTLTMNLKNVISLQPNISNSGLLLIEVTTSNGIFRNKLILNNN